jgi:hypothetical protein
LRGAKSYIAHEFNISRWTVDRCRAAAKFPLRSRLVALNTRAGQYNADHPLNEQADAAAVQVAEARMQEDGNLVTKTSWIVSTPEPQPAHGAPPSPHGMMGHWARYALAAMAQQTCGRIARLGHERPTTALPNLSQPGESACCVVSSRTDPAVWDMMRLGGLEPTE